jgi:hypothetical protein
MLVILEALVAARLALVLPQAQVRQVKETLVERASLGAVMVAEAAALAVQAALLVRGLLALVVLELTLLLQECQLNMPEAVEAVFHQTT